MRSRTGRYMLVFWVLVSLACNFPGLRKTTLPGQYVSVSDLRKTLAARVTTLPATETLAVDSTQFSPETATSPETPAPVDTLQPTRLPEYTDGPPLAESFYPTLVVIPGDPGTFLYTSQPGDTLTALAKRFNVSIDEILASEGLPQQEMIPAGLELVLPNRLENISMTDALLPDSELVYSASGIGFDLRGYIQNAGGYLSTYSEVVNGTRISGADAMERVAIEASLHPRLLLALLEYFSGWVTHRPSGSEVWERPFDFPGEEPRGLFPELSIVSAELSAGYYGWRDGTLLELTLADDSVLRLAPHLNPGTVALQKLFAKFYGPVRWREALYGPQGFLVVFWQMFGDPWAFPAETLFPAGTVQPVLELPFAPGERWSLTGGPHATWKKGSPRGALDLAPVTGEAECAVSRAWITAPSAGLVVRSYRNAVVIDLDGDGFEQTGWVILLFHVADLERVVAGTHVELDERLGHPSCEGGASTGTHLHIARKFNGEWLAANGLLPFVLSGWQVVTGERDYQGELRTGDQVVIASPVGPRTSIIVR